MTDKRFIVRQGDVLLEPVSALPDCCKAVPPEGGRVVLAHGEATGHHHSFALSERVALFREDGAGGGLYLAVSDAPVPLEHQEHHALTVAPGAWRVRRQRTATAGVARRVAD